MPILLETPIPNGSFGPGFEIALRSTAVGPIQNSRWLFDLRPLGIEGPHNVYQVQAPNFNQQQSYNMNGLTTVTPALSAFVQGHNAELTVQLVGDAGVVESTSIQVVNEESAGRIKQGHTEGGGFTESDRAELVQVSGSTVQTLSLDALTLEEITSGPSGGVVSANLGRWIYGVIVRIAEVPPSYRVNTADGDYWVKSLAVVRIYRGSDVWKRVPVHTSSKLISFVEEGLVSAVAALLPVQWLLQISVQVSFAEGVTGQVFLMNEP